MERTLQFGLAMMCLFVVLPGSAGVSCYRCHHDLSKDGNGEVISSITSSINVTCRDGNISQLTPEVCPSGNAKCSTMMKNSTNVRNVTVQTVNRNCVSGSIPIGCTNKDPNPESEGQSTYAECVCLTDGCNTQQSYADMNNLTIDFTATPPMDTPSTAMPAPATSSNDNVTASPGGTVDGNGQTTLAPQSLTCFFGTIMAVVAVIR